MDRAAAFRHSVATTLSYWREWTRDLDDQNMIDLDQERQNLFRAVQFGLNLPQVWEMTADVALQAIPLVNRRMYRLEWLPVLQQLLEQAPAGQDYLQTRLLIQIGRMQRLERQLDPAIETHLLAQQLSTQLDDAQIAALVAYNLGRDYLDKRDYALAEEYCQITLECLEKTNDQKLTAQTLITLGHICRDRGELVQSMDYHFQALTIERTVGDPTHLARSMIELATDLRAMGRSKEAVVYYKEALDVLAPTANELDKTVINLNLGGAYFELEDWVAAEKALRTANSDYLHQSGNTLFRAIASVSLGNVLMKQGRLAKAERELRHSVNLWRQVDDNLNLANAIGSLGEVLAAQENWEAEECLNEALNLLTDYHKEPRAKKLRNLFLAELEKLSNNKQ